MIINRESWHYKLNSYFGLNEWEKYTLCIYFWRTVFFMAFATSISAILLNAIVWPFVEVAVYFGYLDIIFIVGEDPTNWMIPRVFAVIIWTVAGLGLSIACLIKCKEYIEHKAREAELKRKAEDFNSPPREAVEPNFVIEFIKATKKKYCPIIEFKTRKKK